MSLFFLELERLETFEETLRSTVVEDWSAGNRKILKKVKTMCLKMEAEMLAPAIRDLVGQIHSMRTLETTGSPGVLPPSLPVVSPIQARVAEQTRALRDMEERHERLDAEQQTLLKKLSKEKEQRRVVSIQEEDALSLTLPTLRESMDGSVSDGQRPVRSAGRRSSSARVEGVLTSLEGAGAYRDYQAQLAREEYEKQQAERDATEKRNAQLVEAELAKQRCHVHVVYSDHEQVQVMHDEEHRRTLLDGEQARAWMRIMTRFESDLVLVLEREGARELAERQPTQQLKDIALMIAVCHDQEHSGRVDTVEDEATRRRIIFRYMAHEKDQIETRQNTADSYLSLHASFMEQLEHEAYRSRVVDILLPSLPLRFCAVEINESFWRTNVREWENLSRKKVEAVAVEHLSQIFCIRNLHLIQDEMRRLDAVLDTTLDKESESRVSVAEDEEQEFQMLLDQTAHASAALQISQGLFEAYQRGVTNLVAREQRGREILVTEALVDRMECAQLRVGYELQKEKGESLSECIVIVQAFARGKMNL
eukprot:PhM_4_TR8459/c1_g1_i1/m.1199